MKNLLLVLALVFSATLGYTQRLDTIFNGCLERVTQTAILGSNQYEIKGNFYNWSGTFDGTEIPIGTPSNYYILVESSGFAFEMPIVNVIGSGSVMILEVEDIGGLLGGVPGAQAGIYRRMPNCNYIPDIQCLNNTTRAHAMVHNFIKLDSACTNAGIPQVLTVTDNTTYANIAISDTTSSFNLYEGSNITLDISGNDITINAAAEGSSDGVVTPTGSGYTSETLTLARTQGLPAITIGIPQVGVKTQGTLVDSDPVAIDFGPNFTVTQALADVTVTVDFPDDSNTNEIQTLSWDAGTAGNDEITLSDGGGTITITDDVNDADASATNELQIITRTAGTNGNDVLTLSVNSSNDAIVDNVVNSASFATNSGVLTLGTVETADITVNLDGRYSTTDTDDQNLGLSGTTNPTVTITDGTGLTVSGINGIAVTNATGTLQIDGSGITGSTDYINSVSMTDADADDIWDISLTGIGNAGASTTVNLSQYLDNTDAQDLSLSGNILSVTNDPTADVDLSQYLDNTDTQNLGLSGVDQSTNPQITITDGTSLSTAGINGIVVRNNGGTLEIDGSAVSGTFNSFDITDGVTTETVEDSDVVTFGVLANATNTLAVDVSPTDAVDIGFNTSGASNGQVLKFNGTSVEWAADNSAASGMGSFLYTDGTSTVTITDGQSIGVTAGTLIDATLSGNNIVVGLDNTVGANDQVITKVGGTWVAADLPADDAGTDDQNLVFDVTTDPAVPTLEIETGGGDLEFLANNLLTVSGQNTPNQLTYGIDPTGATNGQVITYQTVGGVQWADASSGADGYLQGVTPSIPSTDVVELDFDLNGATDVNDIQFSIADSDANPSNEIQDLTWSAGSNGNDEITLTNGGSTVTITDDTGTDDQSISIADGNNPLLTLESGGTLRLTGGGATTISAVNSTGVITISSTDDSGTDDQTISVADAVSNPTIALESGGTIDLAGGGATSVSASGGVITITSTDNNTQLSQEQVQDFVGTMFSGSETLITVLYDDNGNVVTFEVNDDLSQYDNSTSQFLQSEIDGDPLNEIQTISLDGSTVSLSDGGGSFDLPADQVDDDDADPTNEIQDLNLSGNTLSLTNDPNTGSFSLLPYLDNTDEQILDTLELVGTTLRISISGDGVPFETVDLSSLQDGTGTDSQTLTWNSTTRTIGITNGNSHDLSEGIQDEVGTMVTGNTETRIQVSYDDGANELDFVVEDMYNSGFQVNGANLEITDGAGTLQVPLTSIQDGTGTDNQNLQNGSFNTGNGELTIGIENGNSDVIDLDGRYLQNEVDGSITNEIQSLSWEGGTRVLTLDNGGGSVTITDSEGTDNQNLQNGSFDTGTGVLTMNIEGGSSGTVDLDGRYIQTEVDGSITNEAWVVSDGTNSELVDSDSIFFEGAGNVTTSYNPTTNIMTINSSGGIDTSYVINDSVYIVSGEDVILTGVLPDQAGYAEVRGSQIITSGPFPIDSNLHLVQGMAAGDLRNFTFVNDKLIYIGDTAKFLVNLVYDPLHNFTGLYYDYWLWEIEEFSKTKMGLYVNGNVFDQRLWFNTAGAGFIYPEKQLFSIVTLATGDSVGIAASRTYNVTDSSLYVENAQLVLTQIDNITSGSGGGGGGVPQTLSYSTGNQDLSISGGNTVDLSGLLDNTDEQDLSNGGKTGNNQTIDISGGGSSVTFSVADADSSITNEIQDVWDFVGVRDKEMLAKNKAPTGSFAGTTPESPTDQILFYEDWLVDLYYRTISANSMEIAIGVDSNLLKTFITENVELGTDSVLTEQQVKNYVGEMVTGNTESGIEVTYTGGVLNFNVTEAGTDSQTIDSLDLDGTDLVISLQNDGEVPLKLDLSPLQDGVGTDNQAIDTFDIVGNTVRLSIENDGEVFKSVTLPAGTTYTENEGIDIDGTEISLGHETREAADVAAIGDFNGGDATKVRYIGVNDASGGDYLSILDSENASGTFGNEYPFRIWSTSATNGVNPSTFYTGMEFAQSVDSGVDGDYSDDTEIMAARLRLSSTTNVSGGFGSGAFQILSEDAIHIIPTGSLELQNIPADAGNNNTKVLTLNGDVVEYRTAASLAGGSSDADSLVSAVVSNDSLVLELVSGELVSVDLAAFLDNTDNQTIDSLGLDGTELVISIERDGENPLKIDLSVLQDGTGTDNQGVDNFSLSGNVLTLEVENDGQAAHTATFTGWDTNVSDDYTSSDFDTDFALQTTDGLTEGSSNLYDKTVTVTETNGIKVTGAYPNFGIGIDTLTATDNYVLKFEAGTGPVWAVDETGAPGTSDGVVSSASYSDSTLTLTRTESLGNLTAKIPLPDVTADGVTGVDFNSLTFDASDFDNTGTPGNPVIEVNFPVNNDNDSSNELQGFDVAELSGTTLRLSLSQDADVSEIPLSVLQDGTGTDNQGLFVSGTAAPAIQADNNANNVRFIEGEGLNFTGNETSDEITLEYNLVTLNGQMTENNIENQDRFLVYDNDGDVDTDKHTFMYAQDLKDYVADGTGTDDQTVDEFYLDSNNFLAISLENDGEDTVRVDLSPLASSVDAENGLTKTSNTIKLGGVLTEATQIDLYNSTDVTSYPFTLNHDDGVNGDSLFYTNTGEFWIKANDKATDQRSYFTMGEDGANINMYRGPDNTFGNELYFNMQGRTFGVSNVNGDTTSRILLESELGAMTEVSVVGVGNVGVGSRVITDQNPEVIIRTRDVNDNNATEGALLQLQNTLGAGNGASEFTPYTFPTTAGSGGEILLTNNSGDLVFVDTTGLFNGTGGGSSDGNGNFSASNQNGTYAVDTVNLPGGFVYNMTSTDATEFLEITADSPNNLDRGIKLKASKGGNTASELDIYVRNTGNSIGDKVAIIEHNGDIKVEGENAMINSTSGETAVTSSQSIRLQSGINSNVNIVHPSGTGRIDFGINSNIDNASSVTSLMGLNTNAQLEEFVSPGGGEILISTPSGWTSIDTTGLFGGSGGGGGGIPDLLPVQDVTIDAATNSLRIDSLASFNLTIREDPVYNRRSSFVMADREIEMTVFDKFSSNDATIYFYVNNEGFGVDAENDGTDNFGYFEAKDDRVAMEVLDENGNEGYLGMFADEGSFYVYEDQTIGDYTGFELDGASQNITVYGKFNGVFPADDVPSVNASAWTNNIDGSGQWMDVRQEISDSLSTASQGLTKVGNDIQLGGTIDSIVTLTLDEIGTEADYIKIQSNGELFPSPGRQLRIHNSFVGDHTTGNWSSAGIELMAESDETTGPNRQTFLRLYTKVGDDAGTADEIMSYVNATDGLALLGDSVFITVDTFAKINKNLIVQGQYYTELHTETDGATVTFDFDDGNVQEVTLAGNRTFAFTNAKPGGRYMVKITQDATGSRTVTWPGNIKWSGGSAPTLTTTGGKTDIVSLMYDGTDFYATCSKNF
jgi:hypothetical protein